MSEHHQSSPWIGKLSLKYHKKENKIEIKSSYTQSPFRLQKPFYPEGDNICHSVILHTAGGIVGGDQLQQIIHLEQDTEVFITTPAAHKIYRSNNKTAHHTINITLENNSYLEYLPQETICFNEGYYQQNNIIKLGQNSLYFGWDIIRFGRTARNECFEKGCWQNYTEVWQDDDILWVDRQYLNGASNLFFSSNGLLHKPVVGSLIMIGQEVSSDLLQEVRNLVTMTVCDDELGVTLLQKGLLCRYHGNSVARCKKYLTTIWQFLRGKQGKSSFMKSRIWQ